MAFTINYFCFAGLVLVLMALPQMIWGGPTF